MPSDRETRERRRQAIREILLHDEPVEQQQDLVDRLRARGFAATQSNVSRDLRDIGAVRAQGQYMIPSWTQSEDSPFRKIVPFIRKINAAGPHQLLVVTDPGAGPWWSRPSRTTSGPIWWGRWRGTAPACCSPTTSFSRSSSISASGITWEWIGRGRPTGDGGGGGLRRRGRRG